MKTNKHPEYQYSELAKEILDKGIRKVDRGTNIGLRSLFGRQLRFDLSQGFPLLTTKKVYWKGVLHELYWFMSGQTNIKYLVDNNVHIWDDYPYKIYRGKFKAKSEKRKAKSMLTKEEFVEKIRMDSKFAEKFGNLPRIYGEMWRHWPTRTKGRTIDQLKWALQEMKDDPDAKNLIVNSWNPEYLYTMATHEDASRFPICHNMYQISNRNGKLSLQLYHRSADLFLGVPFNIASYALLTMVLARVTGLEPGEFIHTFGDVHIYENHIEQFKEQLKRTPRPFPKITIDKKVKKLSDFRPEHVTLEGYDPYPIIKAELTVAGGLYNPRTGRMAE
ncbi:MAG: thymidylate synthase [Candidatus Levybacteria bacterium]|nr:thymidylate synthase [Candidatus Levybacteria bacterium]